MEESGRRTAGGSYSADQDFCLANAGVHCIDWTTCVFCESERLARLIRGDEPYKESTLKSALTVRVVDMGYLYVIGREKLVRRIEKRLLPAEVLVGTIDDMVYPE